MFIIKTAMVRRARFVLAAAALLVLYFVSKNVHIEVQVTSRGFTTYLFRPSVATHHPLENGGGAILFQLNPRCFSSPPPRPGGTMHASPMAHRRGAPHPAPAGIHFLYPSLFMLAYSLWRP